MNEVTTARLEYMTPLLSVRHLNKTFGSTRALDDVSLDIYIGRITALLGRNGAGKSTLVSILSGLYSPDSGIIEFLRPGSGRKAQVGCVYQKSMLVPGMTAAENISLMRYPRRGRLIDWSAVDRNSRRLLADWGCADLADHLVEELEPVEAKIVEICRVLSSDPEVLLLDEPTAGLDAAAAQRLFTKIREAAAKGVGIVYVSHYLDEVFQVCDDATILRDGRVVHSGALLDMSVADVVAAMVGPQGAQEQREHISYATNKVLIETRSLTLNNRYQDVTLTVHAGEIVGITGLDGAGHMQLGETICGLTPSSSGQVAVRGHENRISSVRAAISSGVGFTPEDRHHGGYVPGMSVAENVTLGILHDITNSLRVVSGERRDKAYSRLATDWDIKAWGPEQVINELSGGNQQKVVLARSMAADADMLVLLNPTAGVDVAAKASIYRSIEEMASRGKGMLIASGDESDFTVCDRVVVMFRGKILIEFAWPFDDHQISRAVQGEIDD